MTRDAVATSLDCHRDAMPVSVSERSRVRHHAGKDRLRDNALRHKPSNDRERQEYGVQHDGHRKQGHFESRVHIHIVDAARRSEHILVVKTVAMLSSVRYVAW